ncbi:HSCB C-terminal oligomerization domain-containing protein [Panaeolus papilionaceus]|nr:HSCB C-terminal oligomerization domain-containing protein [Panaeolus papilionaceus]
MLVRCSLHRFINSSIPRRVFFYSTCVNCSSPINSNIPVCKSCGSISPLPSHLSHHSLLGIPDKPNPFLIHLPTLKQKFRQAQSICHPDAWSTKPPSQQDMAHTLSSRLNEAYQTLLRPLARAEYILERNGYSLSERDQVDDMAFMMEIMEARETIDEASPDDKSSIEALIEENTQHIESTIKDLTRLISEENWEETKAAAIRLRYLEGIEKAAKRWLENV